MARLGRVSSGPRSYPRVAPARPGVARLEAVEGVEELCAQHEELLARGRWRSMRRSRISSTGPPIVSESLRSRQETVGWASDSSSAARVTLPRRTHASKAMSWGRKPCRKYRRRRARVMLS